MSGEEKKRQCMAIRTVGNSFNEARCENQLMTPPPLNSNWFKAGYLMCKACHDYLTARHSERFFFVLEDGSEVRPTYKQVRKDARR